MRRCLPLWLLLILLTGLAETAQAQSRFFERGDSGFRISYDMIASLGNSNNFDWEWGAHASCTYKGWFDVGAGFEAETQYQDTSIGPRYLLANVVVIQPKSTQGIGLEIKGRFTQWTTDLELFNSIFAKSRDRSFATTLRGYYRNAPANLIFGLSGIYTFNEYQTLDHSDEVLFGHDNGKFGMAFDGHFLAWRLVHFSLQAEYAQNKKYPYDWGFTVRLGVGFLLGLNADPGGPVRAN